MNLMLTNTSSTMLNAMWTVSSCEGAMPTAFQVQWNSTISARDSGTSGALSGDTRSYDIQGLRSGTVYSISFILSDDCGTGSILNRNLSTLTEG